MWLSGIISINLLPTERCAVSGCATVNLGTVLWLYGERGAVGLLDAISEWIN